MGQDYGGEVVQIQAPREPAASMAEIMRVKEPKNPSAAFVKERLRTWAADERVWSMTASQPSVVDPIGMV